MFSLTWSESQLKMNKIYKKDYTANWSDEVFLIKKVKNAVPWTSVVNDLNGEDILGKFMKKIFAKDKPK